VKGYPSLVDDVKLPEIVERFLEGILENAVISMYRYEKRY
jgi:hypothetical protein